MLNVSPFQAAIFDLDGVVTNTARLHSLAWKRLFEEYLKQPFSVEEDYRQYIDGRPRLSGVQTFLKSRNIELPWGQPNDELDAETICALGKRKNALFLELLNAEKPEVYTTTVDWIRQLTALGVHMALVSASKNCEMVLAKTGLQELFPVVVDGSVAEELALCGKPQSDAFLEATRRLGVQPERAFVVEDAAAGIEAGVRGKLGLLLGISRNGQEALLRQSGADVVVADLSELDLIHAPRDAFILHVEHPLFFCDYDGTLAPIQARPDLATLPPQTRRVLELLSEQTVVSVISGRDLNDVRRLVGLDNVYYAGSHGFELSGPGGFFYQYEPALSLLEQLDAAHARLKAALTNEAGVLLERKRFTLALHYRQCPEKAALLETVLSREAGSGLRMRQGKMILELVPDLPWDKGRAVHLLLQRLGVDLKRCTPIYIGDDTTDEDAFRALIDCGLGVVVMTEDRPTLASYKLGSPESVREFLWQYAHER